MRILYSISIVSSVLFAACGVGTNVLGSTGAHEGVAALQGAGASVYSTEANPAMVEVRAVVLGTNGAPVEGAVVVTSVGGQGVSGPDGAVRFVVRTDDADQSLHTTAVAVIDGVNHVGSVSMPAPAGGGAADAGVITLTAGAGLPEAHWIPTFGGEPGASDRILALAVFDDGSGPALYVGGEFFSAGGVAASLIARFDGVSWSPVGEGITGDTVRALAVFDGGDGPALYVGGEFTLAGGASAVNIARWNGDTWFPLTFGVNGPVNALTVLDNGSGQALYIGGEFTQAGGAPANHIARWNGLSWSPLGSGVDGAVNALASFDDGDGPVLYAGGGFSSAGGAPAGRIARWDGDAWSTPGGGTPNVSWHVINALAVFDDGFGSGPALYAAGNYGSIGGVTAANIARWDGAQWSPLGSGVFGPVSALAVFHDGSGPALYASGSFTAAGGAPANHVARWNGVAWTTLGSGLSGTSNIQGHALAVFDDGAGPALYAGGWFATAGGLRVNRIARWSGDSWSRLSAGLTGSVQAVTVFDDGSGSALYAGGGFLSAGGVNVNRIARWDGAQWSRLGSGLNTNVFALAVFDDGSGAGPALYAGGSFTTAGGVTAGRIAKWDGAAWSPLGSGMSGGPFPIVVYALTVFDDGSGAGPALYAGGSFTMAGGMTANSIAKWDGAAWSPLGSGMNGTVRALTVFDDGSGAGPALYVGGGFTQAGGAPAGRIARWDGAAWSPLGAGVINGGVTSLTIFDDGSGPTLYIAGTFTATADELTINRIARWDGASWSALGDGLNDHVYAVAVFDDGDGPALYASGWFTQAGGAPVDRIARWSGSSWSALEDGMKVAEFPGVLELAVLDLDDGDGPLLYAGGAFTVSPGGDSYLARWGFIDAPPPCPADLNGDGSVGAGDLAALLGGWGLCPGCAADLTGDGSVGAGDLAALLGAWGPCP